MAMTRYHSSALNETHSPHTPGTPRTPSDFSQFIPCAATSALFLFARENVIYCIRHSTLTLARKLKKHEADVIFVTPNNISVTDSGGTAISYDREHNAIIWDLYSGEELARLASFASIRVASWMPDDRVLLGACSPQPSAMQLLMLEKVTCPVTSYFSKTLQANMYVSALSMSLSMLWQLLTMAVRWQLGQ
jgi:hypothetical protein